MSNISRQFVARWPQAYAQMQLFLLEMLAAEPEPRAIRIRLAKPLLTPAEIARDIPPLREALTGRLGAGRVRFEAVDGADRHQVQLEYARLVEDGASVEFPVRSTELATRERTVLHAPAGRARSISTSINSLVLRHE